MNASTAGAPGPHRLAELPSWLVSQLALHAHRLVSEALAEAGFRKHHFTVLVALDEQGSTSQAALGRRLWIDRSDLHAVLNDLERDGLVARVRDEDDRRRNLVGLTPAGAVALKRLNAQVEKAQAILLEPLPADERRELRRLLSRLVEHHAQRRHRPPASSR
jgi:MarR family transcriptional regulator, lower aerobic nicotinate degradation pathway regulator